MANLDACSPELLDPASLEANSQFASTIANGLAVLGCFGSGQPTLGNKDISDALGLSRPTVSRLTFTLTGLGYLRRDGRTGKYSLAPAVLSLAYPLLSQLAIRHIAAPEMLELARYVHGPVSIGTRDRLHVVYVETVHANETSATKPDIGSTRPFLRTAIGRALLSTYHEPERAVILRRLQETSAEEWARFGPVTLQAQADLEQRGFCVAIGDWQPTLAGVGVPMQGKLNGLNLAFNLTVPSYATDQERLERDFGPRLVNLVRGIEAKLGLG